MTIWEREKQAFSALKILGKELEQVRELLEDADINNIDSLCTVAEEILLEYAMALEEYQVTAAAGNYTNALDHYLLRTQRSEMLKIIKCAASGKYSKSEIMEMSIKYLEDINEMVKVSEGN